MGRPDRGAGATEAAADANGPAGHLTRARLSVASAFLTHAVVAGTLGPRIPSLKEQSGLDAGGLGVALGGYAVGLFLGTRLAGWPLRRFGARTAIRAGMPVMCAALAVLGLPRSLPMLMVAFGGLGVVSGLLDVAINTQAVAIERGYRRPLMSGIHGIWSAGMLAGSAVGATAAGMGVPPFAHFSFVALLLLAVSSWTMRGLLPANAEEFRPLVTHVTDSGRAVGSASVLALCVIGFSSLFGEGAAADWSAVYLHDELGAAPGVAGLAFVAFSLGMTVARFLGDGLSSRFGSHRVVASGGLLAAASLSLGLLIPEWPVALASFAFLGFALGPIAPTVFSRAGNTSVRGKGTALQMTVTVSYVGSIMGPILIGLIAERLDLRLALGLPAALGLVIAAAAPAVAGGDVTTGEGRPRAPAPRR